MRTEASAESIARAQHDPAAFAPIYQQYADRIFAFCLLHTGNRQQAEDLTADTFERALATIIRYENRGVPFSHWLLRIAANTLVAHIRHDGRAILVDDTCLHEGVAVGQWGMDPARLAERWERADQLMAHIAGLGSDQRRVIQLRFYEDRSIGEIATLMDRTLPAMRQLLYRAIIALRYSVRAEEDGPKPCRITSSGGRIMASPMTHSSESWPTSGRSCVTRRMSRPRGPNDNFSRISGFAW